MLNTLVFNNYHLYPEKFFTINGCEAFSANGMTFLLKSADHLSNEEVFEIKSMADHMVSQGGSAATIIPTVRQELTMWADNRRYMILALHNYKRLYSLNPGRLLSEFHQRGELFPFDCKERNYLGQWNRFWTMRLEQMENWLQERMRAKISRDEKYWIEAFPYFLGISENAIQYITDSVYDDVDGDTQRGTICFRRFPYEQSVESILTPDSWVYDHPARDISEWIRALYWQESDTTDVYKKMTTFLNDYERIKPLTISCWRLIYGRLLFPLHYFEAIEEYYMSKSEDEKNKHKEQLLMIISQTTNYQRFLKDFYKSLGLPVEKLAIPQPEWLQRTV